MEPSSASIHVRFQNVLPEGSNSDGFFSDKGKEDLNTTKSGPSLAHQRNAIKMAFQIKMAFRWRADDDPTLDTGLVAL